MIALEYDDTLAAASGQPFEEHLQEIIKAYDGQYILAVEGAVPVLAHFWLLYGRWTCIY